MLELLDDRAQPVRLRVIVASALGWLCAPETGVRGELASGLDFRTLRPPMIGSDGLSVLEID